MTNLGKQNVILHGQRKKASHSQWQTWEINDQKYYIANGKGRTPTATDVQIKYLEIFIT